MLNRGSSKGASGVSWAVLFGLIVPSAVLMAVDKQAMVVLAPTIRDHYHLTVAQTTDVLSVAVASYALSQIPAGWLCQRLGPPLMLGLACLSWSLSVMALPLASTIVGLSVARFAMGVFQSPDWAASVMMIRSRFPVELRGRASSALLSGLYFGMVIGGPICVSFLSFGTWQWCFYALGALGLGLGAIVLWTQRKDLKADAPKRRASGPIFRTALWFLKPQCLAIGLTYFFLLGIQSFFTTLMPLYLTDVRHLTPTEMGRSSSLSFMFLYGSVILCGAASDFFSRRFSGLWAARIPLGIAGVAGSSLCQYLALQAGSATMAVAFMCLSLFMIGAGQVCVWTSIQDLGRENAGLLVGWTQLLGNGASALVPVVGAYLVQAAHGNWNVIGYIVLLCGLMGMLAVLFVNPQNPLSAPHHEQST
ncbi:MFS transporter [Gluconacetobacter tumulisoli]|uniref:MFS transporter n=1 Tax=Gluconacetobacter tumulisoli TaxID=1286189 RepID=A0A7W4KA09_9PROT|nr:MFS transporter [Gluconacetobacter tumulisoli]MBB2203060.1 MFS transporter [Gluconacetobacter tumulisoli]